MAKSKKWIVNLQKRPQNEIFKKNIMALKQRNKALADRLERHNVDQNYQIVREHEKDPYNLVFLDKNKAYYDLFDLLGKMEKEIDELNFRNVRLAIFFGIGLGYELLYYINTQFDKAWTERMLLVETDINVLYRAFQATDLTSVLARPDFVIVLFDKKMDFFNWYFQCMNGIATIPYLKTIGIVPGYGAMELYGGFYKQVFEAIKEANLSIMRLLGNSPEDSLIGETHMFENIKVIIENPGINMLYNSLAGKPAIVCASGPSLKKEFEWLKTVQDQALIICAESTFFGLMENDIRPHMFCALERLSRNIDNYLDRYDAEAVKDTYFVGVPVLPHEMYEEYKGPVINAFRLFNHFRWLPVEKGALDIKTSSASMAFKIAAAMQCNPIILVGQDLAFDRETNKTHIEEHALGEDQAYLHAQKKIPVMANDGEMSETSQLWYDFLQDYIIDVSLYQGEVINCSKKGAYIEGTKYMPFSEALEKYVYPKAYNPLPIIKDTFNKSFTSIERKKDIENLIKKIKDALHDLDLMIELCDMSTKAILEYKEEFQKEYDGTPIDSARKPKITKAYNHIMKHKTTMRSFETFTMLVLHVVQPYMCSFDLQLNSELGNFDTREETYLYSMERHYGYFERLKPLILMVKEEVLKGQKIVDEYYEEILEQEKVAIS